MLAVAGILLVEAVGNGPWWTAPFRARSTLTDWHRMTHRSRPAALSWQI